MNVYPINQLMEIMRTFKMDNKQKLVLAGKIINAVALEEGESIIGDMLRNTTFSLEKIIDRDF
jgi:hypothetical protein